MENMTIIITMAGLGSRFRKAGYNVPKYMIEAKGKTLFEWSMDSLLDYNEITSKYIFIVRKEDKAASFIKEKCAKYKINNISIVELDEMTDGQATTALLGVEQCTEDSAILIYNIDTYVEPFELRISDIQGDGYIPCFNAPGDHWSFVKVDENGKAIEIKEKERISDNCTIGAYYFKTAQMFKDIYREYYIDRKQDVKERYIAPLYDYMIKRGYQITISMLDEKRVHVLGTPEELNIFLND